MGSRVDTLGDDQMLWENLYLQSHAKSAILSSSLNEFFTCWVIFHDFWSANVFQN